jgi:hypothetical protein
MKDRASNPSTFAVFIDTGVYISALISATGASHAIVYAAEAGAFTVYVSAGVRYFVTLDKKSFKKKIFRPGRRLHVITPSYFLKLLRRLAGERFPGAHR